MYTSKKVQEWSIKPAGITNVGNFENLNVDHNGLIMQTIKKDIWDVVINTRPEAIIAI